MPKSQRVSCLDRDVKKPNRGAPSPLHDVLGNRQMWTIFIKGLIHNTSGSKKFIRTVISDILKGDDLDKNPIQIKVLGGNMKGRALVSFSSHEVALEILRQFLFVTKNSGCEAFWAKENLF